MKVFISMHGGVAFAHSFVDDFGSVLPDVVP